VKADKSTFVLPVRRELSLMEKEKPGSVTHIHNPYCPNEVELMLQAQGIIFQRRQA